jgi:hypothetical protein
MANRDRVPEAVDIDAGTAHPSRVYDYMLGGDVHFRADREAAERGAAALPGGLERACVMVRDQRSFLRRAVEWLAHDVGLRQFLDVGTGIPNGDNVHSVARLVAPDTRVVYVDNDPTVLAHASVLLRGGGDGTTDYLQEDLRRPDRVLAGAASTLDFTQPVGLVLVGVLHLIGDHDDPWSLVGELVQSLASGSYVVISHMASDIEPKMAEAVQRANRTMRDPFVLRSGPDVARLLAGLDLVGPGLVTVDRWHPPGTERQLDGPVTPFYAGVGSKDPDDCGDTPR